MVNVPEWLNRNYPKEIRKCIEELHINEQLEGILDLADFTFLDSICIYPQVDTDKFRLINKRLRCPLIFELVIAQEWLEEKFPLISKEKYKNYHIKERNQITLLEIGNNNLTEILKLEGFDNLTEFNCSGNEINEIDLSNCFNLTVLNCHNNNLTNCDFLTQLNPARLKILNISNNNLPISDLSIFSRFVNLESLSIGGGDESSMIHLKHHNDRFNLWISSLIHLQFLTKLEFLEINCTDIDQGVEYLPNSIKEIHYSANKRPESKIKRIEKEIDEWIVKKWQNIHPGFNENSKKKWENKNFTIELVKEYIDSGLVVDDVDYFYWLKFIKKRDIELVLDVSCEQKLRKEYDFFLQEVKNGSKLSIEVINQIKKLFPPELPIWRNMRLENQIVNQKSIIKNLIPVKKLRKRLKKYGLCKDCLQPNTEMYWCQPCNYFEELNEPKLTNPEINEFVQKWQLESRDWSDKEWLGGWIPYNRFKNIIFLAKGGFGKIYVAEAKSKSSPGCYDNAKFVLKILNNSSNLSVDFLQEITNHRKVDNENLIIKCLGITQDPISNNYIMVMPYISNGNIREGLRFDGELSDKIEKLYFIAKGLKEIHEKGLIHKDLHPGNILSGSGNWLITDLGLCRPANETNNKEIYGVLPYVAPEVLRERKYTKAADIYSWAIISWEIISSYPPYHNRAHDRYLATEICQGLRPKFPINTPQLLEELISRCWDPNPLNRLTSDELKETLKNWVKDITINFKSAEFSLQVREAIAKGREKKISRTFFYQVHPSAFYFSRPLSDFTDNISSQQNYRQSFFQSNTINVQIRELEKKNRDL